MNWYGTWFVVWTLVVSSNGRAFESFIMSFSKCHVLSNLTPKGLGLLVIGSLLGRGGCALETHCFMRP